MSSVVVAALYHFARLPDFEQIQPVLKSLCDECGIVGTLLLADEGINGTIAGPRDGIDRVLAFLRADARLAALEHKESYTDALPFKRMKVRLKREIVTMGVPGTDPRQLVGTYADAAQWNALLADPEVTVVDTRNQFEVDIGTFPGAISPCTRSFREFPKFVAEQLPQDRERPVAMFCTGGIRCEKATSYLKAQGYTRVYHLQGGILKYLETVAPEQNRWQGECFVFDERVSVDAALRPGHHRLCAQCGYPVDQAVEQCPACSGATAVG